jgi:HEAT repeat protein
LVEAMQIVPESTRFEISRALTEMGQAAVEPMLDAIQHPDARVRAVAARVLSLTGGADARNRLEDAARTEKRKTVRKELREASAKIARRLEGGKDWLVGRPRPESIEADEQNGLTQKERAEKGLYFNIVRNLILSNWAKPLLFSAATEAEEILVTLKVDSDGGVSRVLIENKWQNSPLGESLKEAIRRSAPFPPVPDPVARGKPQIDITFILPVPF